MSPRLKLFLNCFGRTKAISRLRFKEPWSGFSPIRMEKITQIPTEPRRWITFHQTGSVLSTTLHLPGSALRIISRQPGSDPLITLHQTLSNLLITFNRPGWDQLETYHLSVPDRPTTCLPQDPDLWIWGISAPLDPDPDSELVISWTLLKVYNHFSLQLF